ncbi:hypothetical protein KA005_34060, partial [bacterium]|nr:hypothetical protein [bacterium]
EDTEENKFFYLKDHLGSIRAVIDEDDSFVSGQDYDMWGYLLENRTFNIDEEKYKFTGKERDDESSYDYFGTSISFPDYHINEQYFSLYQFHPFSISSEI